MPLPDTGWLSDNPISEVLPAMLPVVFSGQYALGAIDFNSVIDPLPVANTISFGDAFVNLDHGISSDGTDYGLVATLIRQGAFGSIIIDTLVIPEIALKTIVKEICPEVATYDKEVCPSNTTYTIEPTMV